MHGMSVSVDAATGCDRLVMRDSPSTGGGGGARTVPTSVKARPKVNREGGDR
jgi:hypothetical protein